MDIDLIKNVIGLVIAIIPLIVVIVTLFNNQIDRTTPSLDITALRVLSIVRHPLKEKDLKALRFRFRLLYFFGILLYSFALFLISTTPPTYYISILENRVSQYMIFLTLIYLIYIWFSWSIFRYKSAYEARYFLFTHAEIVVESDFNYLFNKCHEVLRSMKFNIVEVNEHEGVLEAQRNESKGETIKVHIEKVENSNSSYYVKLIFVVKDREKDPTRYAPHSYFTNRFINKLISLPKSIKEST